MVITVFGYFNRLGIFSFGEWQGSFLRRKIINCYQGGCFDTHNRTLFDFERYNQAKDALRGIGGIQSEVLTKDGRKLESMTFRASDLQEIITNKGGMFRTEPIKIIDTKYEKNKYRIEHIDAKVNRQSCEQYADVIVPSGDKDSTEWQELYAILKKCGVPTITLEDEEGKTFKGFYVKKWKTENPNRPKKNQCVIRCNAPTESYPTAKRDVTRHLLVGLDVICFDYRGTINSEGIPSEGGYYLDGEAIVDKAIDPEIGYGYDPKDIWLEGFCLGASVASHLKYKYHHLGVNYIPQNGFDNAYHTFQQQMWPAGVLAPLATDELRSRDSYIDHLTWQTSFDNIQKLEALSDHEKLKELNAHQLPKQLPGQPQKAGISIIVNSEPGTDTTIAKESHERLCQAARRISTKVVPIVVPPAGKNKNTHSMDVLGVPRVWNQIVDVIAAKDLHEAVDTPPASTTTPQPETSTPAPHSNETDRRTSPPVGIAAKNLVTAAWDLGGSIMSWRLSTPAKV